MMIKRLVQCAFVVALCLWLLVFVTHAQGENHSLTIAILPCNDVVMTFKKFHPLITYLKEETGFDIRTIIPNDFAAFEMSLRNGEIDFVFQDPHTYARTADLFERSALLQSLNGKGTSFQYGVVIARRDSGITKLEDLRGKTVMFGPELSSTKWVAAKALFEKNGLDIDKDLKGYSHGGCCEDIAFNVYLQAVDAGVVCDHFLAEHKEKQKDLGVEAKHLNVVCRTQAVPTRILAARKGLKSEIVTTVNAALLRLDMNKPEHQKILNKAELGGFHMVEEGHLGGFNILAD